MACSRCGKKMEDTWNFCPSCGARKGADPDEVMGRDFFSQMLSGFKENMNQGSGSFSSFPPVVKAGTPVPVRIEIRRTQKGAPSRNTGAPVRLFDGAGRPVRDPSPAGPSAVEATEPQAKVMVDQGRTSVEVSLPGVQSPEDVTIKELESSVEVRAVAGEKLYFRILGKPQSARISRVSFTDGTIRIGF